jgi:hypothetical protein
MLFRYDNLFWHSIIFLKNWQHKQTWGFVIPLLAPTSPQDALLVKTALLCSNKREPLILSTAFTRLIHPERLHIFKQLNHPSMVNF